MGLGEIKKWVFTELKLQRLLIKSVMSYFVGEYYHNDFSMKTLIYISVEETYYLRVGYL